MPAEIRAKKGGGAVVVTMVGRGYPELCRGEGSSPSGDERVGLLRRVCLGFVTG